MDPDYVSFSSPPASPDPEIFSDDCVSIDSENDSLASNLIDSEIVSDFEISESIVSEKGNCKFAHLEYVVREQQKQLVEQRKLIESLKEEIERKHRYTVEKLYMLSECHVSCGKAIRAQRIENGRLKASLSRKLEKVSADVSRQFQSIKNKISGTPFSK